MGASRGRVILVRHGETELNVEHRFRGRADPPLSEAGRDQARRVGGALARFAPARVLSSPRIRARATAEAIGASVAVRYSVDERLDDIDYGAWTGLTREEVVARWPREHEAFLTHPEAARFPGGEAFHDLVRRAREAVGSCVDEPPTVLVTHDVVIRALLTIVLDAPLVAMHRVRCDLASTTGLSIDAEGARLEWSNETCHLRTAAAPRA